MSIIYLYITCIILVYLFIEFIDRKLRKINYRSKKRDLGLRYPQIVVAMDVLQKCITIFAIYILVFAQRAIMFIRIPSTCEVLVLVVAIFTMYGIFTAFIQFLSSFSSSNNQDLFWGRSKIKMILLGSAEYQILDSTIFRILLIYMAIYSVIDFTQIPFVLSTGVVSYMDALFWISVFIAMIEFAILFLKVISISMRLFYLREVKSSSNWIIQHDIQNEYQNLFNISLKAGDDTFIRALFNDLEDAEEAQRENMLNSIVCHVYGWYEWFFEPNDRGVRGIIKKTLKLSLKSDKRRISLNLSDISNLFWVHYRSSGISLSLEKLINIYLLQEELVFHFIKKEADRNEKDFSAAFENIYGRQRSYNNTLSFLDFDESIWSDISSVDHLIMLCEAAHRSPIIKELKRTYFGIDEKWCTDELVTLVIRTYRSFIEKVLKNSQQYSDSLDEKKIAKMLNLISIKENRYNRPLNTEPDESERMDFSDKLRVDTKETLISFIESLENNERDKRYIEVLFSVLETKYIMAYIVQKMLYTGSDRSGWKKEVLFFENLLKSRYFDDDILTVNNIEFVKKYIEANTANHRISSGLITWIFQNINSTVDASTIKECAEKDHINYAIFISFRFIFGDDGRRGYRIWSSKNDESIQAGEWKVEFLNELSQLVDVMKKDYFIEQVFNIYDYGRQKPDVSIMNNKNCRFESYLLVSKFVQSAKILSVIIKQPLVSDALCGFLLIKLSEFGNKSITSLLPNVRSLLAKQYDDILSKSLKTAEGYIEELCTRSSAIGKEIPPHQKERAVRILKALIV